MLASISDNVLASSEGIPRAREANQAVPKLLIAGPRAYPAFVGIQSDIRAIVFWYLVVLGSYRLKRADRGADTAPRTERGRTAWRIGYRRRRTGTSTAHCATAAMRLRSADLPPRICPTEIDPSRLGEVLRAGPSEHLASRE